MPASIKYLLHASLILFCITLFACTNEYEQRAIGIYETYKYELLDSASNLYLPTLVLKRDKTFTLISKNTKISGKWNANDYGDWTVVDFYYDNHRHVQGQLLGKNFEIMQIINPLDFNIDARSLSFKRIEKQ